MSPISCVFTLSAFSRESLMDVRWFLDGLPKTTGLCAHWHSILKMGSTKQAMFLDRIFHLHDIQRRRAGRACVTRLSQEQWVAEIDSICVQTYIYDNMVISKDPKGNPQFSLETLKKVKLGIMEGRLVFVFVILECFIFNLKKDWSTSKFLFLDTSCFHLILPKNVAAEGLCWWCSQPPLGQRPELQAKWFQHVAGQCTSDWHTWSY